MQAILRQVVKLILPILVQWGVKKAEEKFTDAKSGNDKKAYVINKVDEILTANNLENLLNKEKLNILIDDKVKELINKI